MTNLSGVVFGRLTALKWVGSTASGYKKWLCSCTCGETTIGSSHDLRRGAKKSCGCLAREVTAARSRTHGMKKTRTYSSWAAMKSRCHNPRATDFSIYGGKGIIVCARWQKFENFFEDMGERPLDKTLDRIDGTKNYSQSNCRWATTTEQARNVSISRRNTSGVLGVHYRASRKKWGATIGLNGKCKDLGSFDKKEDAVTARKQAVEKYWG